MTIQEMKKRKTELGYTNEQIAELSGVPLGTVQKVFGGTTASPRYDTIQKLERILRPEFLRPLELQRTPAPSAAADHSAGAVPDRSADRSADVLMETPAAYSVVQHQSTWHAKEPGDGDGISGSSSLSSGSSFREAAAPYGGKRQGNYTAADYYALPGHRRTELIDGAFFVMEAPSVPHQLLLSILSCELRSYVKMSGGSCAVLSAPCAVQLNRDDRTVVEPDVMVVCDRGRLNRRGCFGAPDFIIEVLSPQTKRKDMTIKTEKYSAAGVREYWLVDPDSRRILVYDFEHNAFPRIYGFDSKIPVAIWEGALEIDFASISAEIACFYEEEDKK